MKVEIPCGTHIGDAFRILSKKAKETGETVESEFNDHKVEVKPDDDPEELHRAWDVERDKEYRAYVSSPEYAERKRQAEIETKRRGEKQAKALANAPTEMTFLDDDARQKWEQGLATNSDGYGRAVYVFAEQWARLMQGFILVKKKADPKSTPADAIKEFGQEASHLADTVGISGFQYGCAVAILSGVWEFGEALRVWHNLRTQLGTEGEEANRGTGVLNPAILSCGIEKK